MNNNANLDIHKHTTTTTTEDGRCIEIYHWLTETHSATAPSNRSFKGYLHLCHGMAEHIERYHDFAIAMAAEGFYVFGHNHRGHGKNETLGHYADDNGWLKTIHDIKAVQDAVVTEKSLPVFMFAHSMGSFIAQGFAMRYGKHLSGLILSGSNYQQPFLYYAGRLVAKFENFRLGMGKPSQVMDTLSFASFNSHFKPNRTKFDWLSRDPAQVDQYIKDPLCGFQCSAETWRQLLGGLIEISKPINLNKIPTALPMFLLGGERDPVGRMGKGIPALAKKLKQSNHPHLVVKLYKDARHEMLNETCKLDVYQDVSTWIHNICNKQC